MSFLRLLVSTLREIFEEAAYERFCIREHVPRGRSSYARFFRELNRQKVSKVRCC